MGTDTLPIERPFRLAFVGTMLVSLLACAPALAQSTQKPAPPGQARAQPKDAAAATAPSAGDAALKQRVEQLAGAARRHAGCGRHARVACPHGASSVRARMAIAAVTAPTACASMRSRRRCAPWPADRAALPTGARARGPAADPKPPPTRCLPIHRSQSPGLAMRRFGSTTVTAGTGDAVADVPTASTCGAPAVPPPPKQSRASTTAGSEPPGPQVPPVSRRPGRDAGHGAAVIAPPGRPVGKPVAPLLRWPRLPHAARLRGGAGGVEDFLDLRHQGFVWRGTRNTGSARAHSCAAEYKAAAGAFLKGYKATPARGARPTAVEARDVARPAREQKDGACRPTPEPDAVPDAPETSRCAPSRSASASGRPEAAGEFDAPLDVALLIGEAEVDTLFYRHPIFFPTVILAVSRWRRQHGDVVGLRPRTGKAAPEEAASPSLRRGRSRPAPEFGGGAVGRRASAAAMSSCTRSYMATARSLHRRAGCGVRGALSLLSGWRSATVPSGRRRSRHGSHRGLSGGHVSARSRAWQRAGRGSRP